jgi:hypothetical protein
MDKQNIEQLQEKYKEQMRAWMMIQVIGQTSVNFLNVKKLAKEMRTHLTALLENGADYLKEFAEYFIDSCKDSKSYRAAIFGTMSMSDAGAATKLAEDIDQVTGRIPGRFGLEADFAPVRTAFFAVFKEKIPGAEEILSELGIM